MPSNYICALDIGSSKIAAVVAEIKRKHIANIFFETVPIKAIKRGVIVDSINLISSISRVLKNLKVKSGINIKFIHINISGFDIVTKHSRAIIPLTERGNKVITISDIEKVNEQARILGSNLEEEIIHQIPIAYTIDSNDNVSSPIGLYGHRLEVDLYLICGKLSFILSLTRAVNQAGYEIKDLFFSGIATSRAILNKEFKEGINILCDIGSDITELLVFKDGILRNIEVIPLGGDDLTDKLADALKIPFDLAENIKRSYASVGGHGQAKEDSEILVKKDNIYKPIKQKLISDIVSSKTKLICESIKDAVEKNASCSQVINFVAAGRTILLEGFLETLENSLGISVKLGRIAHSDIASLVNKDSALLSGQKHLAYLTSLGLICQALHDREPTQFLSPHTSSRNPLLRLINKIKEIYKEYF